MKTIVILMPVNNKEYVGRKELESIENDKFNNLKDINTSVGTQCSFYSMSEFMDMCNNQEFVENLWWIGYVRVPNAIIV